MNKLFALLLAISPLCLNAQTRPPYVETITNAEKNGITIRALDGQYRSALHTDSTQAVFKGPMADSMANAYRSFLQGLGNHLKKNGFKWEQPTRVWNRIYFNRDGRVEYYLFEFKVPVSEAKQQQYKALFTSYAQQHKIPITASVKFAQCSPVVYTDN